MPIRFPNPPEAIYAAADELTGEEPTRHLLWSGEQGGAPPPVPQPIFSAGLDAIVANDGDVERVAEAPTSWRYASELGGAPQAFELVTEADADEARATRVGDDLFSPAISEALAAAEHDPRVGCADFEARLLRVPGLKLFALWLHATGADDLFVPVAPTAVDAAPGRVYDAGQFRERLRNAAAHTLSLYADADEPDELGG